MPTLQTLQIVDVEPRRPSLLARMRAAVRSFTIPPISVKDPALARLFGDGYRSAAGIVVTEENALTCSAVLNAVMQISNDVAKLPLNLRKRTENGGSEDYVDSKLYNLLKLEPNPEMGSMEFRRTLTAHALTCHGGYAEIERNGVGQPVALWPLTPDRVKPVRQKIRNASGKETLGPLKYEIDGGDSVLDALDVIHIHGLGYDGYVGYQTINKARQAIGLALAAERFGGSFFGNGTQFGGIFSTEMDLDEDTVNAQRELIEKYHQSSEKAWKNLFLLGGWKYQGGAGVDPQKSQMAETRDRQIEEVARFFRMPPYRLGLNKPGTVSYASVELANLDYYTGALLDWITTWEQELNRKLIPRLERRHQYVRHNASAFLRADIKTRYDAYAVMLDRGVFCADDVLQLEDLNPQPNGLGKIYLVQGAQVPKDKVQAIADSNIKKNETPPAPPAPANGGDSEETKAIRDRLGLAERALEEMRAQSESQRAALAAAEAIGTARQEEVQRAEESLRQALANETQLAALVESLRADLAARDAARDATEAKIAEVAEAKAHAEKDAARAALERDAALADAEAHLTRATEQEARATEAERAAAEAAEACRVAQEAKDTAETVASQAIAESEAAVATRDRLAATVAERESAAAALLATQEELRRELADMQARIDAGTADRAQLVEAQALIRRQSEQVLADAAALRVEIEEARALSTSARVAADEAVSARVAAERELDAQRAAVAAAEAERDRIQAEHAALLEAARERQQADAAAAEAREAELAAAKAKAESDRDELARASANNAAAVLSAHRALIVDVMRRMIEREGDRIRRAQASPEKLEQAIKTFYDGHEELCYTALLPAIRVHVAWCGGVDDAEAMTRALVAQHIEQSIRQIRTVLDGDSGELAVSVTTLLRKWETERINQIADVVLQRGIDHIRTRGSQQHG